MKRSRNAHDGNLDIAKPWPAARGPGPPSAVQSSTCSKLSLSVSTGPKHFMSALGHKAKLVFAGTQVYREKTTLKIVFGPLTAG